MTDAEFFAEHVKQEHRVPDVKNNSIAYDFFHTEDLVISRRFGAWKITQVQFKDGSYYNVGQPDQGAH